jgi:hypothetical protein
VGVGGGDGANISAGCSFTHPLTPSRQREGDNYWSKVDIQVQLFFEVNHELQPF